MCISKCVIWSLGQGGGARGIMELMILDDVMRAITLLTKEQDLLKNSPLGKFLDITKDQENQDIFKELQHRTEFKNLLENIRNPIHPTDIFDMITGMPTKLLDGHYIV